jgi:hypothetical protein
MGKRRKRKNAADHPAAAAVVHQHPDAVENRQLHVPVHLHVHDLIPNDARRFTKVVNGIEIIKNNNLGRT